jgi:hypothetical protein
MHQNESHVAPPNVKQNTVSPRSLSGGAKLMQPLAVAFLANREAVGTSFRTEGGSAAVVPYETKLSVADRATLGGAVPRVLGAVTHCCLLLALAVKLRWTPLVSQSYVGKRAVSNRDRSSYTEVCGVRRFAAPRAGTMAAIIRLNRPTAATVAMCPLNPERIADFLPKCSNAVRRNPDAQPSDAQLDY